MGSGVMKRLAYVYATLSLFMGVGVYATWRYTGNDPLDDEPTDATVAFNEFQWPPEVPLN